MIWMTIKGFEDYEVSDQGEVSSRKFGKTRILSPATNADGYLVVGLYGDGGRQHFLVHRLVAAAFLGECPEGYQVCHNDNNPTNNSVSNLRYDTPAGNQADRKIHGTDNGGARNGRAKLTEKDVLSIRTAFTGIHGQQAAFATLFGVCDAVINNIIWGRSWKSAKPTEYVCVRG